MSLMLRKECQDILTKYNLPEYHASISHGNHLAILCECGHVLVSISGIKFNRPTPSKDEIKYAAELFEEFMQKHGATLLKYHQDKEAFKKKPVVQVPAYLCITNQEHQRNPLTNQYGYKYLCYSYSQNNVTITAKFNKFTNQLEKEFSIQVDELSLTKLKKFKFDEQKLKQIQADVLAYHKYEDEKKALESVKQQLSTCEI